jgi:alpha-glucosidase
MFYKEQPDLNWRNSLVRKEMMDVFRFWADKGVDGFRLDVFNEYFKDAQFRNNPSRIGHRGFDRQSHPYDTNQPEIMEVVKEIRSVLDGYSEKYAVGEPFLSSVDQAAGYCGPEKLHATFDFTLLGTRWHPARYLEAILQWEKLVHPDAWPCYVLNNHDNIRSATRFKCGEKDEQLKVAAALLLTLRGTPFMYYGEEIGMRNLEVSKREMQDRVGRTYWPVPVGRDGCRSPMQWNASESSGFTTGSPWIKIHPNHVTRNVERQQSDPRSLLNFYRKLLKVRKTHPALQRGMFIPLIHNPQRVLAYLRQDETESILVALNFVRRPSKLALGGELTRRSWEILVSNREKSQPSIDKGWLKLEGYEVCILVQKEPAGG